MADEQTRRRGFIFEHAERLADELEAFKAERDAEIGKAEAEAARQSGEVRKWSQRAHDLRATIMGIVNDPQSSRQDVQSTLLIALQRNEW